MYHNTNFKGFVDLFTKWANMWQKITIFCVSFLIQSS